MHALRRLPTVARQSDFKFTAVVVDDVLIDVEPGDTTERRYAIAFDLGTTTVVATLLDTSTGTPAAVASMLNKQQPFGADVITRISATMMDPGGAGPAARPGPRDPRRADPRRLRRGRGRPGGDLRDRRRRQRHDDRARARHRPRAARASRRSSCRRATLPELLATDLGVHVHPRARAVVMPALGAYVGGDIVAGMLASGMDRDKRTRLFIDVGTNCEIVLSDGDRIVSTAAPAGPAFEGGAIRCGMRAADGAIEVVKVDPDDGVSRAR